MYEQNTVSVAPNLGRQNEPLHYQFIDGLNLSEIRRLRLDLHENGGYGWPQSRSYGIWSSFLYLPALRELKLFIHLCKRCSKRNDGSWDTSTFCAKTVRNMIAAVPRHVKLIGAQEPVLHSKDRDGQEGRFATADEVEELYDQFKHIRGSDAEIWKTEMECMAQPSAGPASSCEDTPTDSLDELVKAF